MELPLIYAETVMPMNHVMPAEGEPLSLPGALRRRFAQFFGEEASATPVRAARLPATVDALALTAQGVVFLDHRLARDGLNAALPVLAHELAHVVQQRECRAANPSAMAVVVDDRALEAEAEEASRRFLANLAPAVLTVIAAGGYGRHVIVQYQQFGQMGQNTLQQPRVWRDAPAALGGVVNVEYAAVNSRNEVYQNRAQALARARALAGVGRTAKRTYHVTNDVQFNEGAQVQVQGGCPVVRWGRLGSVAITTMVVGRGGGC